MAGEDRRILETTSSSVTFQNVTQSVFPICTVHGTHMWSSLPCHTSHHAFLSIYFIKTRTFEKRRIKPERDQLGDFLLGPHLRRTLDGGENWEVDSINSTHHATNMLVQYSGL